MTISAINREKGNGNAWLHMTVNALGTDEQKKLLKMLITKKDLDKNQLNIIESFLCGEDVMSLRDHQGAENLPEFLEKLHNLISVQRLKGIADVIDSIKNKIANAFKEIGFDSRSSEKITNIINSFSKHLDDILPGFNNSSHSEI